MVHLRIDMVVMEQLLSYFKATPLHLKPLKRTNLYHLFGKAL